MERINIIDCPLGEVGKHLGGYGNIFIIHDRNVGGIVEIGRASCRERV